MWALLMIVFSQPYHVANVDILGTYTEKAVCVNEQKRATAIRTPFRSEAVVGLSLSMRMG